MNQYKKQNEPLYYDQMASCLVKERKGNSKTEFKVSKKLAFNLGGFREVRCSCGFIDVLTYDEIIEVKAADKWTHAMGQILAYGEDYPCHQKVVCLFGEVKNEELVRARLSSFGIKLWVV